MEPSFLAGIATKVEIFAMDTVHDNRLTNIHYFCDCRMLLFMLSQHSNIERAKESGRQRIVYKALDHLCLSDEYIKKKNETNMPTYSHIA